MSESPERLLWEALYALNRAIDPHDESTPRELLVARDDVFELGRRLYGWED